MDAVKGICFKDLPNTLCIHLKRFEYDYEQMTRWKIKDRWTEPSASLLHVRLCMLTCPISLLMPARVQAGVPISG